MTGRWAKVVRVTFFLTLTLSLSGAFAALGVWQLDRRAWKTDLIQRVEQGLSAPAKAAPAPSDWPAITQSSDYRRVFVTGRFLDGEALVKAVTARGDGYWVVAPFRTDDGYVVLINRGFIAADQRAATRIPTDTTVSGLLRSTEPGGAFLRSNDPNSNRWYSRDVAAIAQHLSMTDAAPYFIDAEANRPTSPTEPLGGLTVVTFRNTHLVYAITWFVLMLMSLCASALIVLHARGAPVRPSTVALARN